MRNVVSDRPVEVLLVEDSASDARLAQEAFGEAETENHVHVISTCDDALRFLRGEGPFREQPRPDLVLLDLNLNGSSGIDVLKAIKSDPQLRCIPVVILSTSEHEGDLAQAYDHGANCYIRKPVGYDEFFRVICLLEQFWFQTVTLPAS